MPAAGDLYERVAFDRQDTALDGYGGTRDAWAEMFQVRAAYVHLRGGEAVQSARLAGEHTQVIQVRRSSQTRQITTDWRARDVRTGDVLNIRDITESPDRMWLDILCQKGVAT